MAHYPSDPYDRQKNRFQRWIYIAISVLVIISLAIAFIGGYRLFGKNKGRTKTPKTELSVSAAEPNSLNTSSPAAELIAKAMADINSKPERIIDARDKLDEILPMAMSDQQRTFVKGQLSQLAKEWLFSPKIFTQDKLCSSYTVKPGELLSTIGNEHKVPYEILLQINNITRPEALRAGERIKVINGPFNVRIYRSAFLMDLFLQNTYVRSFKVGLGKPGRETPTGLWRVKSGGKLITPKWTDPDTGKTYKAGDHDYPLGSRWIALEGIEGNAVGKTGIAFHGTKDPNLIGIADSRGCIRLDNGDVILIYNLLVPTFSQVEVVE
jgi:lipoprotein-anchoring transpeptidase ErfK/SrfK